MTLQEQAWQQWWQLKQRDDAATRERIGPHPTIGELSAGASEEQRSAYREYWETDALKAEEQT